MDIIVPVAGNAGRFQDNFENRFDMTVDACRFPVRTSYQVVGVPVMIERYGGPILSDMTCIAFFAEVTFMIVILDVTGDAGRFKLIRKRVVAVAIVAA